MLKAVSFFEEQLRGIRYGEISTGLIDTVRVEAYNQKLAIKQLAWTIADKGRIVVEPYDVSLLGAVNRALLAEGFNSYVFSKTQVVINLPVRSGEDKLKVISQINKMAEDTRVTIRNLRKKARQRDEDNVQAITDEIINTVNSLAKAKISNL